MALRSSTGWRCGARWLDRKCQRRASSRQGATIAPVGQVREQAWQTAAVGAGPLIMGSGRSVRISPEKNHEPRSARDEVGVLADPTEPASRASAFSSTGAVVDAHPVAERSRCACCSSAAQRGERAAQSLVVSRPQSERDT